MNRTKQKKEKKLGGNWRKQKIRGKNRESARRDWKGKKEDKKDKRRVGRSVEGTTKARK